MNIDSIREIYGKNPMRRTDMDPSPFNQFDKWFKDAHKEKLFEPNAMCLATANQEGVPNMRAVLLKGYDDVGFTFYTNTQSTKGKELAENTHVSLLFLWLPLERQIRVNGRVKPLSREDTEKYFKSRPRGSQIGAWASPQSEEVASREYLEEKVAEMEKRFEDGEIPLPEFWGGYQVIPDRIEFWQGRSNRLHDRFLYTLEGDSWRISRLAP